MNTMIAAAVVALSLTMAAPAEVRRAEKEARRDIAAGRLILRSYGWAGPSARAALLQERYGIEVRVVAGCVVSPRIVAETAAYNRVMQAEIERRFGAAVLGKIQASTNRAATGSTP